jgi:predicted acetyltransferase
MSFFVLKEIRQEHLHILDRILQLYVHEINEYFDYPVALDSNGLYRTKKAVKFLSEGFGYFILVNREYAGFVLLNSKTKSPGGVFISEFYILPCFRQGLFYKKVISSLFSELNGHVEFRILQKNKRALVLFEYLTRKYVSRAEITDECENDEKFFRFALDTENVLINLFGYKKHIMPHSKKPIDSLQCSVPR